jgi:hypothetical protein
MDTFNFPAELEYAQYKYLTAVKAQTNSFLYKLLLSTVRPTFASQHVVGWWWPCTPFAIESTIGNCISDK